MIHIDKAAFNHRTKQRVAFYDVDSMDVVWHGNYCKYLEVARCEMLDALGFNYQSMREQGLMFPIVDMQLRYLKPALFDELITIDTYLLEWEYRLKIGYIIKNDKDHVLTKAYTIQAAIDAETKELIIGTPSGLATAMNDIVDRT